MLARRSIKTYLILWLFHFLHPRQDSLDQSLEHGRIDLLIAFEQRVYRHEVAPGREGFDAVLEVVEFALVFQGSGLATLVFIVEDPQLQRAAFDGRHGRCHSIYLSVR